MPMYGYSNKRTGVFMEELFAIGKAPKKIKCAGRVYCRDMSVEGKSLRTRNRAQWPMFCDASGVGPEQIAEARQESIDNGVPTDFTTTGPVESRGRAILTSSSHRRKYLKSIGLHDRSAYC